MVNILYICGLFSYPMVYKYISHVHLGIFRLPSPSVRNVCFLFPACRVVCHVTELCTMSQSYVPCLYNPSVGVSSAGSPPDWGRLTGSTTGKIRLCFTFDTSVMLKPKNIAALCRWMAFIHLLRFPPNKDATSVRLNQRRPASASCSCLDR